MTETLRVVRPNDSAQQRRGTAELELPETNHTPPSAAADGSASGQSRRPSEVNTARNSVNRTTRPVRGTTATPIQVLVPGHPNLSRRGGRSARRGRSGSGSEMTLTGQNSGPQPTAGKIWVPWPAPWMGVPRPPRQDGGPDQVLVLAQRE